MPEYYADWWYEDLPEGAKKAAAALGYVTKADWDESKPVPYKEKKFSELTLSEKRALFFLGMDPIREKLDIWWADADDETKAAALAVGWTQETWDGDWNIQDLPIEHKYWSELTEAELAGATHFGYMQSTWDETDSTDFEDDGEPAPKLEIPPEVEEEKKEDESEEEEEEEEAAEEAEEKPKKKKKKKIRFAMSKMFGNTEEGDKFDDHNHRRVAQIVVHSGKHNVDSIQCTYENGQADKHGGDRGDEHVLDLDSDEYIDSIVVRHASSGIHCLTFTTNKGNTLGPCGGKGNVLRGQKIGEEQEVKAPSGMKLTGIVGHADEHVKAIGFRWGSK